MIPGMIIICGIQLACKGNEATGEMLFVDGEVSVPCCEACRNYLGKANLREETIEVGSGSENSDEGSGIQGAVQLARRLSRRLLDKVRSDRD